MRRAAFSLSVFSGVLLLGACNLLTPSLPEDEAILDGPIEGLTPEQMGQFLRGDEEFGRRFAARDGLGPIFNAPSCDTCHPGDGRAHPEFGFTRFGRYRADGSFDPMPERGGPQLQDRGVPGYPAEELPQGDDIVTTRLIGPSMTGLGLLEAVNDEDILALADPQDIDGDGISGRISWVPDNDNLRQIAAQSDDGDGARLLRSDDRYIGRFGRKATNINLLHQAVSAYHQDMGITSDFATVDPVNMQLGPDARDVAPDPEITSEVTLSVAFYLRTLRAPARRNANDPDVQAGEKLFDEIGCADCHIPTMTSGLARVEALSNKTFHPYTDLLLHDMGPALDDGYTEGNAESAEWRTTPLWGLGLAATFQGGTPYYLHDGRATTLPQAIELHGGEGQASRENYRALTQAQKDQLIAFLESL